VINNRCSFCDRTGDHEHNFVEADKHFAVTAERDAAEALLAEVGLEWLVQKLNRVKIETDFAADCLEDLATLKNARGDATYALEALKNALRALGVEETDCGESV